MRRERSLMFAHGSGSNPRWSLSARYVAHDAPRILKLGRPSRCVSAFTRTRPTP